LNSLRKFRDHGVPGVVRAAWWSWLPLGAFLQHFVYLTYPLAMRRAGELTRERAWRCALSIAWMPAGWAALWALAPDVVRPANLWLALGVFLVLEELVNLPHHVDMPTTGGRLPLWQQAYSTRSCYYPRGISELVVLNFNFHIEHHLFPSLPWYRLRRARDLVRPALGAAYEECVGIGWNLRNRSRDLEAIVARYRTAASQGTS
jgi:fatty acid desaturase